MNSKSLMVASSFVLGLAGILTLFIPNEILIAAGLLTTSPLPIFIQLFGALYFALALMNWMAKGNAIGGIYSRPVSMGNFTHFFIGTLILGNAQLFNGANGFMLAVLIVYAIFAVLFWWLAFKSNGIGK